jgi:hypothetical protein
MGSLCCGESDDNSQQNHLNGRQNYVRLYRLLNWIHFT